MMLRSRQRLGPVVDAESTSRRVAPPRVRDVVKADAVTSVVSGEHADGVLTKGTDEMLGQYGLVDVKRVVRHWASSQLEEKPQRPGVRGRGGSRTGWYATVDSNSRTKPRMCPSRALTCWRLRGGIPLVHQVRPEGNGVACG